MKKLFLLAALILSLTAVNAQNAVGVRLGFGGELSAQFGKGGGRIEGDLGLFPHNTNVTVEYQLVNNLSDGFKWYYGGGGTLGLWDVAPTGVSIGAVGALGLEYNFSFPIQVSIDYRPTIYLVRAGGIDVLDLSGVGFGIRYRF